MSGCCFIKAFPHATQAMHVEIAASLLKDRMKMSFSQADNSFEICQ
jgi:hypothetical protein